MRSSSSQPRIPSEFEIRDSKAVFRKLQHDNRLRRQRLAGKHEEVKKLEELEKAEKLIKIEEEKKARTDSAASRRNLVKERMERSRKRQEE